MHKQLALFLVLLLCLELTACAPATEDVPPLSMESSSESPTEPPHVSKTIEPPLLLTEGNRSMIIAEVLEITTESMVEWDMEFTKVKCRLVYGYKPRKHRYRERVSEQGEFPLYLTADALQQLGQAEMVLLCSLMYPDEGYAVKGIIPIADGHIVLDGEWWLNPGAGMLGVINDHIYYLADKRTRGEELSETEQLAPTSPLENGMTVEEIIAFFDIWGIYWDQVAEDFIARRAQLYGWA